MPDFETFNIVEGVFWIALGLAALVVSFTAVREYRNLARFTAAALVLFGISDFIEVRTGAFWEPAWLLAINAACVLGIIAGMVWYFRIRRG